MRVLGLDPGSRRTGWGVVERRARELYCVAAGHVAPPARLSLAERLHAIVREVDEVMERFAPDHVVIEAAFHHAFARSTLVLHDRHLVDAFVDPRRHRYGGPLWLLRLIWRLIHKPDLVILLDAPPGVIQARKQEVPFEETARQREAYLSLIETMKDGHVVDAARPLERVISDVNDIILRHLAARIARRSGLGAKFAPPAPRFDVFESQN